MVPRRLRESKPTRDRCQSTRVVLMRDSSGMFMFVGPLLLLLTTIFEWIMGNFFPM
jgi:hypothetical protein